ncbi:MAG: hypothetical protein ACTTKH_03200 [Treponema sp.]
MQRRCLVGIQPIDLQTLYSQMEKVGKQQGAEQSGAIANRERQEEANKIDAEKRLNSVKFLESMNNEKLSVDDNTHPKGSGYNQKHKKKENQSDEEQKEDNYIKDPKLGARVDISG